MKMTRHNGRSGKHGTYNPKHNDRRFDIGNSDHIDQERAKQNVYWDCYQGFRFPSDQADENRSLIPSSRSSVLIILSITVLTATASMSETGSPGIPAETGRRTISGKTKRPVRKNP